MDPRELPTLRVLVCGSCGIGKSALINRAFGVRVTESSDRKRVPHNVEQEITWKYTPDLVFHDSQGFQAGEVAEVEMVTNFLKKKSEGELSRRLDVIWFCIDASSASIKQTSTEKIFQAISKYAKDARLVVIATKKDNFLSIEEGQAKRILREQGQTVKIEDCERYAQEKLQALLRGLERDINDLRDHSDPCVAVSMHDPESITSLCEITLELFSFGRKIFPPQYPRSIPDGA